MIGNFTKLAIGVASLMAGSIVFAGDCDGYLQDADAVAGVVPNMTDNGLKSLSIYSEQAFMVPKRSLVNKARRQAEMKGKRAFSEWIKERVVAGTLNEELMEQAERTTSDGLTEGSVEEITKYSDYIGSQTESVLSGIIKLDECMDPDEKVIYVRMGWKPALSEFAGDARATIDNAVARGENGKTSSTGSSSGATRVEAVGGYRVKSKYADNF